MAVTSLPLVEYASVEVLMEFDEIYEPHLKGLIKLASISDESYQELLTVLQGTAPSQFLPGEVGDLSAMVKSIPAGETEAIIVAIVGSAIGRAGAGQTIEDLVKAIGEDLRRNAELELPERAIRRFQRRAATLFKIDAIRIGAKAFELQLENVNNYDGVRVLTDIRPIFEDNPTERPKGFILIHTLKINYSTTTGEDSEFYVSLNTKDLQMLIDALKRAKTKAQSARALLESSKCVNVE